MTRQSVFHWLDSRGWLVFSGSANSGIRAQILNRLSTDGAVVLLTTGGEDVETADAALADLEELGAPAGYLVDVSTEDDETVRARVSEASLVVLETQAETQRVKSALQGAADEGIRAALANGAWLLAEGRAAEAVGEWYLRSSQDVRAGLNWLSQAFVLVGDATPAEVIKRLLSEQPQAIVLSIASGSALVLGPDGEIETWGEGRVTVVLGQSLLHN